MNKKLIIWDFDGVIADTEKLWLQNRMEMLNEKFDLNWDINTISKFLGGMSDKTKQEVLDKMGIKTDKLFWDEIARCDFQEMMKGFALTPGIEDIFKMSEYAQCIATGGVVSKTEQKIRMVGIEKYFSKNNVFSADLVEYGKPEPDLFLLAAETMGYAPDECVVIEDSIAGLTAAQRAKMMPIAFVGSDLYGSAHIRQIRKMGVEHIFNNMADVKDFIIHLA